MDEKERKYLADFFCFFLQNIKMALNEVTIKEAPTLTAKKKISNENQK